MLSLKSPIKNARGFTLIEVMLSAAVLLVLIVLIMNLLGVFSKTVNVGQKISTRDRIMGSIRNLAGMPASLRSSIRASAADGINSYNPKLRDCVANSAAGACQHGVEVPFTLFSPSVFMDASGVPTGLIPLTAPMGAVTPMRFDAHGSPCASTSTDCLLKVYTAFKAECPPPPLPATPPPTNDPNYLTFFEPMASCTIADSIHVIFRVELDDSAKSDPSLTAFAQPITDSVTVSVKAIFGNDPR